MHRQIRGGAIPFQRIGNSVGTTLLLSDVVELLNLGRKSQPKRSTSISARTENVPSWRSLLTAIFDSSNDAIISKDLHGRITSWNEAACSIFGYTAAEIVGEPILRIVPKELHDQEEKLLQRLRAGEIVERLETTRLNKHGHLVDVSVTLSPIRDETGEVTGVVSISHDISDRKQVERLLIRSEKLAATGRMAATVAHEINNPLESVLNFVYLARRSTPSHEKAHEYLLSAEGELDRVTQIIRRVLGYYSETGRQDEVFLHEILAEALAVYQAQLHACGISVDCRYEDHHRIAVSWNEFTQAFSTILGDSIQILPRGSALLFDVEETEVADQEGIQVMLRMRAQGMHRELFDRAFAPLSTAQGKISSSIGLSVARELLEKRGAQVSYQCNQLSVVSDVSICIFVPFA